MGGAHMGRKISAKFIRKFLKAWSHYKDLGAGGRVILMWILRHRMREIGFIWLRIETTDKLLWLWTFTFHQMQGIGLAEQLVASQEGLYSTEFLLEMYNNALWWNGKLSHFITFPHHLYNMGVLWSFSHRDHQFSSLWVCGHMTTVFCCCE